MFAPALADRTGRPAVVPEHLARLCAIDGATAAVDALEALRTTGWLTEISKVATDRTRLALTLSPQTWQTVPNSEPDRPPPIQQAVAGLRGRGGS
ncbi:hypothetical protein [Streptomyces sp. NPDC049040]|uniref:hypothetical protein n=1 Tax=Streptomyces sp. NPDC049040 TaxID=3365593 RepID=UPI00371FE84F